MTVYRYPTPEWLEESGKRYHATPRFQQALQKITTKIFFLIRAEPAWGIEQDITFGAITEKGALLDLRFFSSQEAREKADFILGATPQEWKKILRKENKFLTDFMLGKISLEFGSKVGVLGLAPYANTFIEAITQFELQYPDEMSPDELAEFRSYVSDFRDRLAV
jgi:putative sterol carrier protein